MQGFDSDQQYLPQRKNMDMATFKTHNKYSFLVCCSKVASASLPHWTQNPENPFVVYFFEIELCFFLSKTFTSFRFSNQSFFCIENFSGFFYRIA